MTRPIVTRVAGLFAVLGAATHAAAALDRGRRPADRDLGTLGIDPAAYRAIGR